MSLQCGRPLCIPDDSHNRQLPSEVDDCFIDKDIIKQQPLEIPSKMSLFIYSTKLYKTLRQILQMLYRPTSTIKEYFMDHFLECTMKAGEDLDRFAEDLPSHLNLLSSYTDDRYVRQRNILAGRYHNVRIIMGKASLLSFMPRSNDQRDPSPVRPAGLLEATTLNMALLCVNNAQMLIALMCKTDREKLGLSWNNMYYCYNAASVLIAAKCCPMVMSQCNLESIDASFNEALAMLAGYTNICKGAPERSLRTLQFLKERFSADYFHGNGNIETFKF